MDQDQSFLDALKELVQGYRAASNTVERRQEILTALTEVGDEIEEEDEDDGDEDDNPAA
jgi:hypothetical protein